MEIFTEVIGSVHNPDWHEKIHHIKDVEVIYLDQWTAQKSRFLAKGDKGNEYPVALKRGSRIIDGDILYYNPEESKAVIVRLNLNPVLVIDMSGLRVMEPEEIIRISVELGHAIGNQHWPAVVKGDKVYVPLTVDRKVMLSVMETHHIEGITYEFKEGLDVIPYLAPHEMRSLFGGASHESHAHVHTDAEGHEHIHAHIHY